MEADQRNDWKNMKAKAGEKVSYQKQPEFVN